MISHHDHHQCYHYHYHLCRQHHFIIRVLKQTRHRRKRERHLKMSLHVSAIIFQVFKVIMLEKCVLTIRELNWNQRLGHKRTKLNICPYMLTLSTQLQNRSFHHVERTRTSSKCQKMKNAHAKRAKILFFTVKCANLWGFGCRRRRSYLSSLLYAHGITDGVSGVSKCRTICFLPIKHPKLHNIYSPVKQIFILLNMFVIRGLVFLS